MIMLLLIDVFAVLPEIVPAPESHHGVASLSAYAGLGEVISLSDGHSIFKEHLEVYLSVEEMFLYAVNI